MPESIVPNASFSDRGGDYRVVDEVVDRRDAQFFARSSLRCVIGVRRGARPTPSDSPS